MKISTEESLNKYSESVVAEFVRNIFLIDEERKD